MAETKDVVKNLQSIVERFERASKRIKDASAEANKVTRKSARTKKLPVAHASSTERKKAGLVEFRADEGKRRGGRR